MLDSEETFLNRQVFTIVDAFSNTGGLLGILFGVLNIILYGIEEAFLFSSLISELYRCEASVFGSKVKKGAAP
jgi:hypothetical protein